MDALNEYWWEVDKSKLHEVLFGVVRFLEQNHGDRRRQNLQNMRLYGNQNLLGFSAKTYSQLDSVGGMQNRVTYNIVQSMVDTVTNKIAKNKPKPSFLTSGGDWSLKKKAKLLEKFTQGQFYEVDLYAKAPTVFRDACVFDVGALHIYREEDEIKAERVFCDELWVDPAEAIYGNPRSLYRVKQMPKEVMVRLFPKYKSKIMAAKRAESGFAIHENLSNQVQVVESWHLRSGPKANDGRHVICIENEVLFDEQWKYDYFPFEFLTWGTRLLGFYGQSLAEQLTGIQVEINKILRTIQLSFHLMGTPAVLLEMGAKINKAHLNNEVGRIIEFSGMKPEIWAQNPVAIQLFEHLEKLTDRAYQISGVSQLAAMSQKPSGLDSGKALRVYNDIEAERFVLTGQSYERFFLGCASKMIDLAKEIHEEKGEYSVTVKSKKFIEKIDWSQIDLKEDEYEMQMFPTSFLQSTPSGKLSDVQELMQAGMIDQTYGRKLLDFPDLDSYMSLANAAIDDIEHQIEAMLDKEEYNPPEPYQDLALGIKTVQSAYLKAKNDNAPESALELLRRWIEDANRLMNPPQAACVMPPVGLQGGQPIAVPQAPPTSDMLPVGAA